LAWRKIKQRVKWPTEPSEQITKWPKEPRGNNKMAQGATKKFKNTTEEKNLGGDGQA